MRCRLFLADVDDDKLRAVGHSLFEAGVDVHTLRTDVTKQSHLDALADEVFDRFGQVGLLINTASVAVVGPAWERTHADWSWALGVNLWGVIHATRSFVPRMLARNNPAHIVNVASTAGLLCPPLSAPFVTTQHGVMAFSECLKHDLALQQSPIGVTVVCCGPIKTSVVATEDARPAEFKNRVPVDQPFAREIESFYREQAASGMEPDKVAGMVLDAVAAKRFYLFTHPKQLGAARERFERLLAGDNPTTRPLAHSGS